MNLKNDQKDLNICKQYGHHTSINSDEAEPNLLHQQ